MSSMLYTSMRYRNEAVAGCVQGVDDGIGKVLDSLDKQPTGIKTVAEAIAAAQTAK
jgi:hypothetical protein